MSDIQRYNITCEGESYPDPHGVVVEYQDHKAREQKLLDCIDFNASSHADEIAIKEDIYKAREQELEADVKSLSSLVKKMTNKSNKHKADAIEDGLREILTDNHEYASTRDGFIDGFAYCCKLFKEQADKLREGNDMPLFIHQSTTLTDWRERAEHYEVLCDKLEAREQELLARLDKALKHSIAIQDDHTEMQSKIESLKADAIEEMHMKLLDEVHTFRQGQDNCYECRDVDGFIENWIAKLKDDKDEKS